METSQTASTASKRRVAPLIAFLLLVAYVAGFIASLHEFPRREFARNWARMVSHVGVNTWLRRHKLADETSREVVRPNNDTLYSTAALDLDQGPLLIEAPAADRYWSLQFIADNTDAFAIIGSRELGLNHAARVLLVPAGFSGDSKGLEVIQSPTSHVWLLARFLVSGRDDIDHGYQLQNQLHISHWSTP